MSALVVWLGKSPPLLATGGDQEPPDAPGEHEHGAGAGPREDPTVLIVEDDWMVSLQIETILQGEGYVVVGKAVDADEAVRLAGELRPRLVLMDIRLQGSKDGIAAATAIRNHFDIPSLYVTAHSDPGTIARGNAAAPVGWIEKPFTELDLIAAVRQALPPPADPQA